jgi:hypothetical protein
MESTAVVRARTTPSLLLVSEGWMLGSLVALSAVIRFFLSALPLQTPFYLPDEYTYSTLARSIAETGRPVIRGVPAHFPALLEPLLAAPFWTFGGPELAFRLTQAEHAVAISLGAIPVYLLCRRLGLGSRFSIGVAALVLVSPDLVLGSLIVADPIAYPLVLGAVYAAVVALDSPSRRAQLAVVGLVGLATFARVQYVLLVPVLIVAAFVVERGRMRRAIQSFGLASLVFAALGIVAVASGPHRVLGAYDVVFKLHASLGTIAHQIGLHALLVPFAAGIVLVPGALVGLARGLTRPASRAESAFAAITSLLALGLIGQAIFIGATISGNFGERYLFFFFPLLAAAFGLYAARGGSRGSVLVLSGLFAVLAMRFPLSHYSSLSSDSTTLWAVDRLEALLGTADGALVVSVGGVVLAAVAAYVGWRPRKRASVALVVAIAAQAGVAVAASSWAVRLSTADRHALPSDLRWVDDAHVGRVALVEPYGNDSGAAIEQLLWNRSITNVALLPHASLIDSHTNTPIHVTADGALTMGGGPVRGAVLVDRRRTWTSFADARLVRTTVGTFQAPFDLWAPTSGSQVRLVAEVAGLRSDNWLMRTGWVTVWPAAFERRLTLRVALPSKLAAADTIHFTGEDANTSFTVQPEQTRTISFVIPARNRPWTVHWTCDRYGYRNGATVSFLSAPPRITAVGGPLR